MGKIYKPSRIPSYADYVEGLTAIKSLMSESQLRLLQQQYYALNHTIGATELSEVADIQGGRGTVNLLYGRLGKMFCDATGFEPDRREIGTHRWWSVWSTGHEEGTRFFWEMHPQVVEALESLGWVIPNELMQSKKDETLYEKIFNELFFERDDRSPPDNKRKAQFKIGWENVTLNRRKYTEEKLNLVLTWNNLGYRFGSKLGELSDLKINAAYNFLAQKYLTNHSEVTLVNNTSIFPDEIDVSETYSEGSTRQILVNTYERDPKARQKCIEHYGLNCSVCDFNFGKTFGKIGEGFIHVHHLRPISEIGEEYEIDPIKDLCPVCPNCHAMIHRSSSLLSIEELKKIIQEQSV